MFCPKCGTENKEGTNDVCAHCAAQLDKRLLHPSPKKRWGAPRLPIYFAVLLIIAMFFLIAMPTFMTFSTRAIVPRAKSGMRSLAAALEAYYDEHNAYPAWSVGPGSLNNNEYPSFTLHTPQNGLMTLTTPVAYIPGLFHDPCVKREVTQRPELKYFNYYSTGSSWIQWSAGPDKDYDIDLQVVEQVIDWSKSQPGPEMLPYTYDPTNGTRSDGAMFRFKN